MSKRKSEKSLAEQARAVSSDWDDFAVVKRGTGASSSLHFIGLLESALELPAEQWSSANLDRFSRREWASAFHKIEHYFRKEKGFAKVGKERMVLPYSTNIDVPFPSPSLAASSVYLNTNHQTTDELMRRIKKTLLYTHHILFEDPISQLQFDHYYIPGDANADSTRLLYSLKIDSPGSRAEWLSMSPQEHNDKLFHYEQIKPWILLYKQLAPLIRKGFLIPVSTYGDIYARYARHIGDFRDSRSFDKDDGFRNLEDEVASKAWNAIEGSKLLRNALEINYPEAFDQGRLAFIELALSEFLLRQLPSPLAPMLEVSTGDMAMSLIKLHLQEQHHAEFSEYFQHVTIAANHVPNPDAIDISDIVAMRSDEPLFERWRSCLATAGRRAADVSDGRAAVEFVREMRSTSLSWNADLDAHLAKNSNLSDLFKSVGQKFVIRSACVAGTGLFGVPLSAQALAVGSSLAYDLLTSFTDRKKAKKKDAQRFTVKRLYAAFEPKTPIDELS